MGEFGQMKYNGPFSKTTKTWNGLSLDVCKSGIQKSLRRRNLDEMIWYVNEMALFYKIDQENVLTNLINRLVIMAGEELVFADALRFILIYKAADSYKKDKSQYYRLYEICKLLCDGRLLRLGSDIRNTFYKGVKAGLIKVKKPNMKEKDIKFRNLFKKEGDPEELITYFGYFTKLMKRKDDDMFYWALKIYYKYRNVSSVAKRFNKKRGVYILWVYLFEKTKNHKYAKKCLKYYMKEFNRLTLPESAKRGNEQNLFLINGILMVKNLDKINWDKDSIQYKEISDEGVNFLLNKNMKDGLIEIKDYIIDMHTYEGKVKGKDSLAFAFEGSVVIDEDKEFFVQKYRDVYHNLKRVQAGEEVMMPTEIKTEDMPYIKWKELHDVDFCNDGNVCCSKRVCISARYKGKYFVLKESGKGTNYGIDQVIVDRMKKFVGLKSMNAKRVKMDTIVRKVNRKEKSYNDNFRMEKEDAIYLMMDKFDGEMIRERKKNDWYSDENIRREYIKIGLFRGIFRVTDFNELNVLVNEDNELLSIDEMLIGKKKNILGIMNSELKEKISDDYSKGKLKEVFREIDFDNEELKKVLKEMGKMEYYDMIVENKENIEEDFTDELYCD